MAAGVHMKTPRITVRSVEAREDRVRRRGRRGRDPRGIASLGAGQWARRAGPPRLAATSHRWLWDSVVRLWMGRRCQMRTGFQTLRTQKGTFIMNYLLL